MSNLSGTFMSMVGLASQKRREALANAQNAARDGDVSALRDYCRANKGRSYVTTEIYQILNEVIMQPDTYHSPREVVRFAETMPLDYEDFFENFPAVEHYPGALMLSIYSMHAIDPRPETAETAALFLAEFLKLRVVQEQYDNNFEYEILSDYITQCGAVMGIKNPDDEAYVRTSILAVQNALVDYVAAEGKTLPINRGAPFLCLAEDGVPSELSRLWKQKVTDVKVTTGYHPVKGDVSIVRTTFAP